MIHDFADSLAYSHEQSDQPWWERVYRQAFPDFAAMVDLRDDGWHQRAGRDRALVLTSGRTVYVDEKVRSEAYRDVLLEVWSRYPKNGAPPYRPVPGAAPGWARKPLDCDWLAYAFVPARTCYLFPFLGVRAALEAHRRVWIDAATTKRGGFRWVISENATYNTVCIAVPTKALQDAIAEAMTVTWAPATDEWPAVATPDNGRAA